MHASLERISKLLSAAMFAALTLYAPAAGLADDEAAHETLAGGPVSGARTDSPSFGYSIGTGKSCEADGGEGTLVCNCDPPGALVYLDGQLIGETPVRKECLPSGEYTLKLIKPGFETSEISVTVKKDVTLTVEDKLSEATGEVFVTSDPPGVSVTFDGRRTGVTPVTVGRVTEGVHEVRFSREYFEDAVVSVSIGRAGRKDVAATLRRRVLFIGTGDAAVDDAVADMFDGFDAVHVIREDIGGLADELAGRGLEADSLDFLKSGRQRLEIEDLAVLSGIMEQAGVELALTAVPVDGGGGDGVELLLYSSAVDMADRVTVRPEGTGGLRAGLEQFISGWRAQQRGRSVIGAALSGREEGVEVVTPLASPVETCAEGADCLINLAIVDSLAILDETTGQAAPAGLRGYAALDLGDAYSRAGETEKAADAFAAANTGTRRGVCTGTALYRLGEAYEKLGRFKDAAAAYESVVAGYPEATLISADGPWAAPLAAGKIEALRKRGLILLLPLLR